MKRLVSIFILGLSVLSLPALADDRLRTLTIDGVNAVNLLVAIQAAGAQVAGDNLAVLSIGCSQNYCSGEGWVTKCLFTQTIPGSQEKKANMVFHTEAVRLLETMVAAGVRYGSASNVVCKIAIEPACTLETY